MTAEIAVMNQEAVALAADSAVSGPKIFTSANKIFSLSKYHPVAVMVNDSAQFLGVPWETIIKTYRTRLGQRSFDTLREQAAHFLGFFHQQNPLFPKAAQTTCNQALFERFFRWMLEAIDRKLEELTSDGRELDLAEIASESASIIDEAAGIYVVSAENPSSADELQAVAEEYSDLIDECIEKTFQDLPIASNTRARLREIALKLVTDGPANLAAHSIPGL
jgi:hypothetical protein